MPESTFSDPYDAVIADLEAKIGQMQMLVAGLKAARAGAAATGPSGGSATIIEPPQSPVGEGPGWLLGLTIPDAAKKVLASRRQPLRNPDFAKAFESGGLVLNSKDPANTIGSVLTRRFNEVGDIVKIGRGTWGLKEWYPNRSFKKERGENGDTKTGAPNPEVPTIPNKVSAA